MSMTLRSAFRRMRAYRPGVFLTLMLVLGAYILGRAGGFLEYSDVIVSAVEAPCDAACQAVAGDRRAAHQNTDSPFSAEQVAKLEASFGPDRVKELIRALTAGPTHQDRLTVRRLVLKCGYWLPLQEFWGGVRHREYWVGRWYGDVDTGGAAPEEWWTNHKTYDLASGQLFASIPQDRDSLDCPTFSWGGAG